MTQRGRRVLDLIAAFKFVKAAALFAASAGALGLLNPRMMQWTTEWLEHLALGHGPHLLEELAGRTAPAVESATPHRLVLFAVGAFLYGAVFVVEGFGLTRDRRWAEYLTVGVTLSFLPFEVVALAHKTTLPRVGTLVLNALVVSYLVWRLRTARDRAA